MKSASLSPIALKTRFTRLASFSLMRIVAWIFSQIRGTAKKRVGWISRRLTCTVSMDSAKLRVTPAPTIVHVEKMRSAT